ncbi:MAG: TrkH family potassium uptake protein [Oscillospiraceae bacterium]|nr:TrkH family potassium uptake protein [Oscillospiraceae bacterium]
MSGSPKLRAFGPLKKQNISSTRIIVSSFLGVILVGTLLLMLPFSTRDGNISFLNAFFTATSATCVTGLVVFDTYTKFTLFGQIVILTLIQIGGLGLVTFATFFNLAMGHRLAFKTLRTAGESVSALAVSEAGGLIRSVIRITFSFELIGAALLSLAFVPRFGIKGIAIALFIAISAFCNAGFDVFGFMGEYSSLTGFVGDHYVQFVVIGLIIAGGLGFLVWCDLFRYRTTKKIMLHTKLVVLITVTLLAFGTFGIAALEWDNPATLAAMPINDRFMAAFFQSVSTRTAGFNTFDLGACNNVTKLFMSFLMFIGAAPGGTGGGIKVTTLALLLVTVSSVCAGRSETTVFGRKISKDTIYRALSIMLLGFTAVVISSMAIFFNTTAGVNEIDSIFEAASAFATVGLSVGATAQMQSAAKIITIITMFIGRVGPVSLAISLSEHTNNATRHEILPEGKVIVG